MYRRLPSADASVAFCSEWFEPRGHVISRFCMFVRVSVVQKKTVGDSDWLTCKSHQQSPFVSDNDFPTSCWNGSHCQQSFSELQSPERLHDLFTTTFLVLPNFHSLMILPTFYCTTKSISSFLNGRMMLMYRNDKNKTNKIHSTLTLTSAIWAADIFGFEL